ncbi:MAG TPA: TlpA disulfide reductase family protein [Pyrinomonadaceae bacterium]|nr:TlpA disulfide reductase family protein [Pyrinomonadaceae bacterium]
MKSLARTLALSLCGLLLLGCGGAGESAEVAVGSPAPDFSLESLDGVTVKSSSLKGEVVVLNFWATYCQPCRGEIPQLNEFAASSGAKVVGISLDQDGASTVRRYEKEENLKLNYTVLLGDEETFQRFNGVGIPYTLVLDRAQRIVKIYRGPVRKEELERDLAVINQRT